MSGLPWIVAVGIAMAVLLIALGRLAAGGGRLDGLALAIGPAIFYVAGHWGLSGVDVAPVDVTHWLPHVAVLAAVAATIDLQLREGKALRARTGLRVLSGAVLGLAATWLLVRPLLAQADQALEVVGLITAPAALLLLSIAVLQRALSESNGWVGTMIGTVLGGAIAALCAASGSLTLGILAGMAAAMFGGSTAALLVVKRAIRIDSLVVVASAILWGAALVTYHYASMRDSVVGVVAALPLLVAAAAWLGAQKGPRWAAVAATLTGLVVAAAGMSQALTPEAVNLPEESGASDGDSDGDDDGEYDYGYQ